ncbi:MAG: MFS transporter [Gammaproteobacteria bacterium]|nr:MFS transporter [Gammaproteobacteria bacterium]
MDSYRFYLGARGFYAICWTCMVTVNMVFMVEIAGLDPLQMVLVGTVLEGSVFLFEIPTGVVADAVSRKLSVIIGHVMIGVGFLVLALFPSFVIILLSQVIWGVGWTFISGAYVAWLSEEVGVERANEAFLRGSQISHTAAFFGIGAAITLAHISLQLPIMVGAIGVIGLGVSMCFLMRESGFEPTVVGERDTWSVMRLTFRSGVTKIRSRPVLLVMLGITAVFGMFSEGIDRLFTPYLIESFELPGLGDLGSVTWWGIIAAVSSLVGLAATTVARSQVDLSDQAKLTWVLGSFLLTIGLLVLLIANSSGFMMVLGCYWLVGGLRSAYDPLVTAWLNRLLPAESKATLFSMYGQADALGQTVGGPVIGALAKYVSIAFALGTSAVVLLPSLPMYRKAAKELQTGSQQ